MDNEYRTAIHEAGHAVVALAVGVPLAEATIVPEGDFLGHVFAPSGARYWQDGDDGCLRELVEADCIVSLAGGVAERLLLPAPFDRRGCSSDYRNVREWLRKWELCRGAIMRRTERLVRRHAEAIERVAEALIAHRRLPGEDVVTLCR